MYRDSYGDLAPAPAAGGGPTLGDLINAGPCPHENERGEPIACSEADARGIVILNVGPVRCKLAWTELELTTLCTACGKPLDDAHGETD